MSLLGLKNKVAPSIAIVVHGIAQYVAVNAYAFAKNVFDPRTLKNFGVLLNHVKLLILAQSVTFLFTKFFIVPSLLFIISKVINSKPKKAILEPDDTSLNILEFVQEVPCSNIPSEDPMGLLTIFLLGIWIIVYIYID